MRRTKGTKIEFLGYDSQVTFGSITQLAKHLSMSIHRVQNYLDGRTILDDKDYETLVKMSYEMPTIGMGDGNKNRKRKAS